MHPYSAPLAVVMLVVSGISLVMAIGSIAGYVYEGKKVRITLAAFFCFCFYVFAKAFTHIYLGDF